MRVAAAVAAGGADFSDRIADPQRQTGDSKCGFQASLAWHSAQAVCLLKTPWSSSPFIRVSRSTRDPLWEAPERLALRRSAPFISSERQRISRPREGPPAAVECPAGRAEPLWPEQF